MNKLPKVDEWAVQQPDRRTVDRFQLRPVEAQLISDVFIDTVRLVNVGRLGFSVRSFIYYETGCKVTLVINGFEDRPARVAWFARGQVGARFEDPMNEEELLSLILGAGSQRPVRTDKAQAVPPVRVHSPNLHPGLPEDVHHP